MLDCIPTPLLDDFLRGRWLPLVGAGFSKNARFEHGYMPDWPELADALKAELRGYKPQNPVDAISAYEEEYGRPRLVERLAEILHVGDATLGSVHEALCRVGFDVIVTTNFDFLIERAYTSIGQPCQTVVVEAQLSQGPVANQAQLLKIHGDLSHPDDLVVTEDDFDRFLVDHALMATYVANLLITRTPVLVGYSIDDPDTRALWALIRNRLGRLRRLGYVLQLDASDTEVARFARRGFRVVNLPGASYSDAFGELFAALHDVRIRHLSSTAPATEDEVAAELVMPLGVPTRLCYCSVPASLLVWYRSEIFPVLESAGFVTVTLEDIAAPGGSAAATGEALLARAQLALIDVGDGSGYVEYELRAALARLEPERVLLIRGEGERDRADLPAIVRRGLGATETDALVDGLLQRIVRLGRVRSEPQELLESGHYGAAVVTACGILEEAIATRLRVPSGERPVGALRLLRLAAEHGWVRDDELARISRWVELRNAVVHRNARPSAEEARAAVAGLEGMAERLS